MNAKRTISFLSALCLALTGPAASLNAAAATAPPKDGTGTYEGMKYEIMSGKCYIKGYTSKLAEELVIPSEIKNAKVVWIDNAAFKDCKTLKSVTIPETVTLLTAIRSAGLLGSKTSRQRIRWSRSVSLSLTALPAPAASPFRKASNGSVRTLSATMTTSRMFPSRIHLCTWATVRSWTVTG